MATLVHDDLIDGAQFRRGRAAAWAAYGPDAARAAGDYLFARAFAELAATGDPAAVAMLARRDALPRARRGAAAAADARSRHDGRELPRALRAEDGEAVRGRVPARLRRPRLGARPLRARARHRLPDHRRHPRLHGRGARDRQDRRRRPPRGHADAAAAPRGAAGRGRPPARSPAARSTGLSSASPPPTRCPARGRSRSTTPAAPAAASTASSTATSSRLSPTSWCTGTHDGDPSRSFSWPLREGLEPRRAGALPAGGGGHVQGDPGSGSSSGVRWWLILVPLCACVAVVLPHRAARRSRRRP